MLPNDIYEGDPLEALLQAIEEKDKDKFQSMDDLLRALEESKTPISPEVPPYEQAKAFVTETVPTNITSAISRLDKTIRKHFAKTYGYGGETPYLPQGIPSREEIVDAVRMLPGNEDLPPWPDQDTKTKIRTAAQAGSLVAAFFAAVQTVGVGAMGFRDWIRMNRIAKMPTTRAETLKAAGKKVEITRGFAVKEPEVRLKPIKPAVGVPSTQKIFEEFNRSIPRIVRVVGNRKVVPVGKLKGLAQDYVYRQLNAFTPSRVADQAIQDASNRLVERTLKGVPAEMNLNFAKSLFAKGSMLEKLIPVAVEQLKAYGHISPTLFGEKAVSPEEQIVDREMPRPLTETPEEYAALGEAALRAEEEVRPGGIESIGLSVKEIEKGDFPTFVAPDIADQMRYGMDEKSFLVQAKESLTKVKDALGNAFYRNYALRFNLKKPDVDMMFREFFSTTELREKAAKEWVKHTFGVIDAKDATALDLHQEWPDKYPIPDRLKEIAGKQTAVYEFWNKIMIQYGVYKEGFPLSMIHRSLKQIETLKEEIGYLKQPAAIKRKRAKVEQLEELVGILKGVRYIPHRYLGRIENMIIEESADKDVTRLIPRQYSNVLRATFKEIKGRNVPTLDDAVKLGLIPQLDARHNMLNYILYAQREIAKVDLARKLIKGSDLILPEDQNPGDWQKVAMAAFKGYVVHPALADAIDEVAGIRGKEWQPLVWYAKVARVTKLLKFFLPQIMMINNLWQAYRIAGVRAAIDPTVWHWSIKQMTGDTPLYKRFIELDLFPTPPDVRPSKRTQDEMIMMWVRAMDKNYPKLARAVERATNGEWNFKGKNPAQCLGRFVKGAYAMIWNTTWTLDRIQRMNSTKRLMDKGASMEVAVEKARFFHIDYADLPGEARRKLNLLLLTPTYRIGTLKTYRRILAHPIEYRGVIGRELLAWLGLALGATVTGHTLKEYYRVTKAMGEGEEQVYTVPSGMAELQKYLGRGPYASWRIYASVPLYAIDAILVRNKDWKGDQIYYPAESAGEQAADIADFILRTVFPPLEMMGMMKDKDISLKNKLLRFLAISGYTRKTSEFWKGYRLDEIEYQANKLLMDKYPEGAPQEVLDALTERMLKRGEAVIEEKPGLLDIGAHTQRGLKWGLEKVFD